MGRKASEQPAVVMAVDGEVAICGPGRIGGSLTPDAAEETARRLAARAKEAREGLPEGRPDEASSFNV